MCAFFFVFSVERYDPEDIDPIGVFHGSELPFVFDFEAALLTDNERDLAKTVGSFWQQLAAKADPNSGGSGAAGVWPAYTVAGDEAMVLASPVASDAKAQTDLKKANCDYWDANPLSTSVVFGTSVL